VRVEGCELPLPHGSTIPAPRLPVVFTMCLECITARLVSAGQAVETQSLCISQSAFASIPELHELPRENSRSNAINFPKMRRHSSSRFWFRCAGGASAQQVVALHRNHGPVRGDNTASTTSFNSFETGYRWRRSWKSDEYRSQVITARDCGYFGSFLNRQLARRATAASLMKLRSRTQGLGNDPYESATLRIQKNRLYRYDMAWRLTTTKSRG